MPIRNLEGLKELITQLWQKAICKMYEIQCSICNKYVSLKFSFLQKIKTHYQDFWEKLETVTSETLKIKTQFVRNGTSEI